MPQYKKNAEVVVLMKSKRTARVIALVLALVMLLSIFFIVIDALTQPASANTQAEINRLSEEKKEYDRQKREIQSRINDIEFEKMAQVAQKGVLDDRIILTGQEIESINELIDLYEVLIKEKEFEVEEAQAREDEQFAKYRRRVRDMEENGAITYLEILFDSTSFSDLLARWDFVGDIMRADETIYFNLMRAREETQLAKDALEQTKEELNEENVQLVLRSIELEEQLEQANALIDQIMQTLETEQALYDAVNAEAERTQQEINRKVDEQRREEERRRLATASRVRGTGQFRWPVPSSGNITSQFGVRMHPVFRVNRMHWGIDISASHGVNVIAADTGTVIISAFDSSYGHYVVINHGNGFTTLYAHLSSRRVGAGTVVSKGDVIGLIGSTGVSTGPHLHFEVAINGARVNPVPYL